MLENCKQASRKHITNRMKFSNLQVLAFLHLPSIVCVLVQTQTLLQRQRRPFRPFSRKNYNAICFQLRPNFQLSAFRSDATNSGILFSARNNSAMFRVFLLKQNIHVYIHQIFSEWYSLLFHGVHILSVGYLYINNFVCVRFLKTMKSDICMMYLTVMCTHVSVSL